MCGIAWDKKQISTECWCDATTIREMKRFRWDGSGSREGLRRRQASPNKKLKFAVHANTIPAPWIWRIGTGENRYAHLVELFDGGVRLPGFWCFVFRQKFAS